MPPEEQPEAEKVAANVFAVKAKDRATDQEHVLHVTKNENIRTQADAENHIANMPGSFGGKHPGFEVVPADLETKEKLPAAIERSEAQAAVDQATRQ